MDIGGRRHLLGATKRQVAKAFEGCPSFIFRFLTPSYSPLDWTCISGKSQVILPCYCIREMCREELSWECKRAHVRMSFANRALEKIRNGIKNHRTISSGYAGLARFWGLPRTVIVPAFVF